MKYRIIRRPRDEMYYIQTWDEKSYECNMFKRTRGPKWQDYDGDMGVYHTDLPFIFDCYKDGFFSLAPAKKALKIIKDQAERDNAPDEVVWEEND